MRIVDTHLHLIHLDRFRYPWLDDVPALDRSHSLEDYRRDAGSLGIEAALHMEADVAPAAIEAETRHVLSLGAPVVGAIASCRPEDQDFPAELERLAAIGGVKGFRRILHTSPDALSRSSLFAENLRRLAPLGLPFDLCVLARQLPLGAELARRCPDVSFVLDHCGVPDIAAGGLDPWRADIEALAQLPNVSAKLSGIAAYAGPDWTTDTLRPFAEHTIECFGFERMVWGSDAPVVTLTASLKRWVEATMTLLEGCSPSEKASLLSDNAARIYRL